MNRLKVRYCEHTCDACPSQWDIFTEDGRYIYGRYRWGYLELTLTDSPETFFAGMGEVIFEGVFGDDLDGYMSTDELQRLTSEILDWGND